MATLQKNYKWWANLLKLFLFGMPVLLVALVILKHSKSHSLVFTSLPPPPQSLSSPPEVSGPSAIQLMHIENDEMNRPEIAAEVNKVVEFETALRKLEAKVYSNNPALWTYEHYNAVIKEWSNHSLTNRNAWNEFENASGPEKGQRRRKARADLQQLLPLVLLKEQANTPTFGPLIKDTMESVLRLSPNYMNFSDADGLVVRDSGLIFRRTSNVSSKTYEQWLSEIDQRYPVYVSAIDKIARENVIPAGAMDAVRNDVTEQTLSGLVVELYLPTQTPKELLELRQELDQKTRELFRMLETVRKNKQ